MIATLFDVAPKARHPARYSDELIPVLAQCLRGTTRILDPFGGTGKIFKLSFWLPGAQIEALEIEPEWAAYDQRITVGNALDLPWPNDYFDAICTSPTYANRMADHHNARDASMRNTYRHALGRPLSPDNSGALQWGEKYREFHRRAWAEADRVLAPGGLFVLNISDHIRKGKRQPVSEWHVSTLLAMGYRLLERHDVKTRRNLHGANSEKRVESEWVLKLRKAA